MEETTKSQFDSFESQLSRAALQYISESAKWSKFLAIVGFVFCGILALASFFIMFVGSAIGSLSAFGGGAGFLLGFVYLIITVIYFFPILYLYRYAINATNAIKTSNVNHLTKAFENLKSHHKFLGIFTLIMIGIYAIIFIFGILSTVLLN